MFVMTSLCAKHKTDVSVLKMSLKKSFIFNLTSQYTHLRRAEPPSLILSDPTS